MGDAVIVGFEALVGVWENNGDYRVGCMEQHVEMVMKCLHCTLVDGFEEWAKASCRGPGRPRKGMCLNDGAGKEETEIGSHTALGVGCVSVWVGVLIVVTVVGIMTITQPVLLHAWVSDRAPHSRPLLIGCANTTHGIGQSWVWPYRFQSTLDAMANHEIKFKTIYEIRDCIIMHGIDLQGTKYNVHKLVQNFNRHIGWCTGGCYTLTSTFSKCLCAQPVLNSPLLPLRQPSGCG